MSKLKAKQPEVVNPGKSKAMIYGASGAGKTWFSLAFPVPYYIDTEGGADLRHYQDRLKKAGGVYLGPEEGSLDFDSVLSEIQTLATEKHPYKTLIIDSITKLYQTAIANEAARLGEKDAFGASKKAPIAKMRQLVNWVTKLDMNVWFVAHEASEWGVNQKTLQREEIGKIADVWDKLIYELDLTLQIVKRGPSRIAIVRKSRLLGFPDLDTFSLDEDSGYSNFAERYGKDFIEAETKIIVLANVEQVTEMKRLTELLHVSESDMEKLLTKYQADKLEEFTTEQANSVILSLNKRITGGK